MVRVISEKLFSPPRSRHSSGDTVDRELAARAVEALSSLNSRRLEFVSHYESSSDSHWDSEVDVDGDGNGNETRGPSIVGEESSGEADAVQKRQERRRERNKRSAQAYRSRRREHCVKQQTVLQELQQKNGQLKGTVLSLQDQIQHLRRCAVTRPLPPNPTTPSTNTTPTAATATTSTPTPAVDTASCLHHTDGAPVRVSEGGEEGSCGPVRVSEGGEEGSCGPMDNEANRSRLLSPLLDNFSFTQPSPAASPAASPLLSPSAAASPRFSFPPPPSPGTDSALSRPLTSARFPRPLFMSPSDPSAGRERLSPAGPHPDPQPLFHFPPPPPHIDLNANSSDTGGNLNQRHTTQAMRCWCENNDSVNNNRGTDRSALTGAQGGARPKTKTGGGESVVRSSQGFRHPMI